MTPTPSPHPPTPPTLRQIYVGRRFYVNAYKGLRHQNYGMDLLVALGTSTAYGYSLLALGYACGWPHAGEAGGMEGVSEGGCVCMGGSFHVIGLGWHGWTGGVDFRPSPP